MLLTPDHELEEVWEKVLRNVVGGTSLCSVLVQHQDVPGGRVFCWSLKLYLVLLPEEPVQSLILHIREAMQGNLHAPLPQQDGPHLDVLEVIHLSESKGKLAHCFSNVF